MVAYCIGYLLIEETHLGNVLIYIIAAIAFLMAMYDIVFEAIKYSMEKEFLIIKD